MIPQVLFGELELARAPGLIEPRREGAILSQDSEPALAGDGLDSVDFVSLQGSHPTLTGFCGR